MLFLCLCGFYSGSLASSMSRNMQVKWIGNSKLTVGVYEKLNRLSINPATKWHQTVTLPSPYDSKDWLQQIPVALNTRASCDLNVFPMNVLLLKSCPKRPNIEKVSHINQHFYVVSHPEWFLYFSSLITPSSKHNAPFSLEWPGHVTLYVTPGYVQMRKVLQFTNMPL